MKELLPCTEGVRQLLCVVSALVVSKYMHMERASVYMQKCEHEPCVFALS